MKYIDMHCDTLMPFAWKQRETYNIYDSSKMVDLKKMKSADAMAQFFAIFMLPENMWDRLGVEKISDFDYINMLRDGYERDISKHSDIIAFAKSYQDIVDNYKSGKMSAMLTIEDSRYVEGKLDRIDWFYEIGVRVMGLIWNNKNCMGSPNSRDEKIMNEGLTKFGFEAVEYMQYKGIVVDVSHLSDGGFYDVAKISKVPFVATHSNARTLSPHPRNLKDDMIKIIAEKGGVTGLNFGPDFLPYDLNEKISTVELLAKHARHIADVGGVDVVAIGADFDGVSGNMEISDCSKMPLLVDGLKKVGFKEDEIAKIFHKNVLRVLKDTLK